MYEDVAQEREHYRQQLGAMMDYIAQQAGAHSYTSGELVVSLADQRPDVRLHSTLLSDVGVRLRQEGVSVRSVHYNAIRGGLVIRC